MTAIQLHDDQMKHLQEKKRKKKHTHKILNAQIDSGVRNLQNRFQKLLAAACWLLQA